MDIVQENQLPTNIVSCEHLEALARFQADKDLLLAPKFNMSLITPGHFSKMKVGQALQVFSHSVSAALNYMVDIEGYDSALKTTAWFVEQTNHWFHLMSSRHPVMALSRQQYYKYQEAIDFLKSFSKTITGCTFGKKGAWKPVQSGIQLSTKSIIELSEDLLESSGFLLTSRFTQDCLENVFSSVRYKNPVPTPLEFKNALKLISVSQFLKQSSASSYNADDNDYLVDFLGMQPAPATIEEAIEEVVVCDLSATEICGAEEAALYYIAGYCLQSLKKKKQLCSTCLPTTKHDGTSLAEATLTRLKEYKADALFHCSIDVFRVLKVVEDIIRQLEPYVTTLSDARKSILTNCDQSPALAEITFSSKCHDIKTTIIKKFVGLRIQIICKKLRALVKSAGKTSAMGSKSMQMREAVKYVK